jgi:hypothetical protein
MQAGTSHTDLVVASAAHSAACARLHLHDAIIDQSTGKISATKAQKQIQVSVGWECHCHTIALSGNGLGLY